MPTNPAAPSQPKDPRDPGPLPHDPSKPVDA